jgi:hypothetical protein
MTFQRNDDIDPNGNNRVNYTLIDCPGYTFTAIATKQGVQLTGTTPPYTDFRAINQVLVWVQYQYNQLKTRGTSIPQNFIDSGMIWPMTP